MATAFNFIGAFAGTAVAKTIGSGLVDDATSTTTVVAAALIGAITWNLITWRQGIPSSSSHALIGGLLGATLIAAGPSALNPQGIWDKVLVPDGHVAAAGLLHRARVGRCACSGSSSSARRRPMTTGFRRLQVVSAGFMAFSHGSNDAQKTMGIITLALFSAGLIPTVDVPDWVIVVSATAISLGTAFGGWRIMHTMGHRVVKLEPVHGFAARNDGRKRSSSARLTSECRSRRHMSSRRRSWASARRAALRAVRWGVARSILVAWVVTIPAAGLVAAASWWILNMLGLG